MTFDPFWIIHLILRLVLGIFDISTLRISLWLFENHTFQKQKSLSLFPSQILVCATDFCSSISLFHFEIYIWWALLQKHKNKSGKIYRLRSIQVSRLSRLLTNHSWQAWKSIYNSYIDFKISLIKIYVHTEQAWLVNVLHH